VPNRKHLIFVNYRGSDEKWAIELVYARMTEAFGVESVFKAGNSLRLGEVFPPILEEKAASCPVMLVCIGPGWLTASGPDGRRALDSPDDRVRREIAISLRAGHHVVPVLIGNHNQVSVPKAAELPEDIRAVIHRQARWLAPGGGLDLTVPALIESLVALVPELGERRAAARSEVTDGPENTDQTETVPQGPGVIQYFTAEGPGSIAAGTYHGIVNIATHSHPKPGP